MVALPPGRTPNAVSRGGRLPAAVRFDLALSAGLAFQLGGLLGATTRLATPWQDGLRFTFGAGPMLVTGTGFGTAAFAQATRHRVAIERRFRLHHRAGDRRRGEDFDRRPVNGDRNRQLHLSSFAST